MARKDQIGLFWSDYKAPKEKKKCIPPSQVWLNDDYLPGLAEASVNKGITFMTEEDLCQAYKNKDKFIFDIECYENYFLIAFMSVQTEKVCYWEIIYDQKLDIPSLRSFIECFTIIGFNSRNYDIPILSIAMMGRNTKILKQATNEIISYGLRADDVLKSFKALRLKKVDHIDLIEVCPLSAPLKLYAGRLHCQKMQDLPFHPDKILSPPQITITRYYCFNDLRNTLLLYNNLLVELELRDELSEKYGIDLRSKSDAQIAEAVIGSELRKLTNKRITKPVILPGTTYYYKKPGYIKFQTPLLNWVLNLFLTTPLIVGDGGSILKPELFKKVDVKIGATSYTVGIGGLHSNEQNIAYRSNEDYILKDVDVESFYPKIILNLSLYPEQLGINFLMVFKGIVDRRLAAKLYKKMKESNSLKIVINGSFGKFGSKYSILYAPYLVIMTTITGQLSLLMLIERIELLGISVVSANTDGVVSYVPKHLEAQFDALVKQWEIETNFKMEETLYSALYSRDVNNYIAIKTDGKVKHKGAYSNHWNDNNSFRFHKNPTNLICIDAVTDYLTKQTPIEKTINECQDITKFITVRDVKGGGALVENDKPPKYLGKSVRFYRSTEIEGEIVYVKSGNKVPLTNECKPCMELPDSFPKDINFEWYIRESYRILNDIGVFNDYTRNT
jgi:hypothetical protein